MGPVVPILVVVAFWIVVFFFNFGIFTRWLKAPTEAEIEAMEEQHHISAGETAASVTH